jgi:hypothetical protein
MCNWKLIDQTKGCFDLFNLELIFRFLANKRDEDSFYLISSITDFRIATIIKTGYFMN